MYTSYTSLALLALLARCASVSAEEPSQAEVGLAKRIDYAPPPGGWNSIDWNKIFHNGQPATSATPASPASPVVAEKKKVAVVPGASASSVSSSSIVEDDISTSSTSSSATCPQGCSMTIKFTDDSMDVPFAAGGGGQPSTGTTKGTCICMNSGSVRVNIGSHSTASHSTLIEGNAAGLNAASFFDVSYVEGYSYPVVCWSGDGSMSGSPIDLYAHGKCPSSGANNNMKMGDICVNPGFTILAGGGDACWECTLPDQFFSPVSGAAYTYPRDDSNCASDGGSSGSPMANGGDLTCCIGTHCRKNTQSAGGQTSGGRCDSGCTPCAGHGECTKCKAHAKRSLESVFEAAGPTARKHKRHTHSHTAFHAVNHGIS